MKLKLSVIGKKIVFIAASVVALTAITAITVGADKKPNPYGRERITEKEYNEKFGELEEVTSWKEEYNGVDEIKMKFEADDRAEEKKNKADIPAYGILARYCGEEYARDDILHDYETDLIYMRKMAELLKTQKLEDNEVEVLRNYLSRRYEMLTDEQVIKEFAEFAK